MRVAALLAGVFVAAAAGLAWAQEEEQRVNIASDSAVYGAGGDDVVFAGNVAATIGLWHLAAATLQVRGGEYFAYGNPLTASGTTQNGGTIMISASFLQYDGKDEVQVIGAPVRAGLLSDDGDITVRAQTITYHLQNGDALLEGDALLGRGAEQITGSRISININTGAMKAEQGRVRAILESGDKPAQ